METATRENGRGDEQQESKRYDGLPLPGQDSAGNIAHGIRERRTRCSKSPQISRRFEIIRVVETHE